MSSESAKFSVARALDPYSITFAQHDCRRKFFGKKPCAERAYWAVQYGDADRKASSSLLALGQNRLRHAVQMWSNKGLSLVA
jgi:hypothetical protein